MKIFIKSIT